MMSHLCFVTASIWAWVIYLKNIYSLKWTILVGVFVGCAILNKWLPGLLIYGGWVIYILLNKNLRFNKK